MAVAEKIKNITVGSNNSASRYTPQGTGSRVLEGDLHTGDHGSIIHNGQRWKQTKWPSLDQWVKMERTHSREGNSASQRKDIRHLLQRG